MSSNVARAGDFYPNRVDMYVPNMMYDSYVHDDGDYKMSLGTPNLADTDGIVDGVTITGGVTLTASDFNGAEAPGSAEWETEAPFGRAVQVVGSAAGTPVAQIKGHDYLGQQMQENITLSGTTPVLGKKAFKRIHEIVVASGITGTIDVGTQDVLGLPFKTIAVKEELADGAVQSAGTFVAPVLTDPQTATTGDPRGTYNPTAALTGAKEIIVRAIADNWSNASDNGGLHGIKHFSF